MESTLERCSCCSRELPSAYIFDLDGTLAINNHGRGWFDYDKVGKDIVNENVARILRVLDNNTRAKIFIITGRSDSCRTITEEWLYQNLISIYEGDLLMRIDGDHREDYVVKKELYEQHIANKYNVLGVFEDRNQVVGMWRSLGLTCFQVADGNY